MGLAPVLARRHADRLVLNDHFRPTSLIRAMSLSAPNNGTGRLARIQHWMPTRATMASNTPPRHGNRPHVTETNDATPIRSFDDFLTPFAEWARPREPRIGAEMEKFGVYKATNEPVHYAGDRGILRVLQTLVRDHAWSPGVREPRGPAPRAAQERSVDHAGACRAARALGRAAHHDPPDLRGASRPPPRARADLEGARDHLARTRLPAVRDARRSRADGAQAALRDHARVPADARRSRARHDAPHLHRAGELRLQLGGRAAMRMLRVVA